MAFRGQDQGDCDTPKTCVDYEDLQAKLLFVRSALQTWTTKLDRDLESYTANCEGVADPNGELPDRT